MVGGGGQMVGGGGGGGMVGGGDGGQMVGEGFPFVPQVNCRPAMYFTDGEWSKEGRITTEYDVLEEEHCRCECARIASCVGWSFRIHGKTCVLSGNETIDARNGWELWSFGTAGCVTANCAAYPILAPRWMIKLIG